MCVFAYTYNNKMYIRFHTSQRMAEYPFDYSIENVTKTNQSIK